MDGAITEKEALNGGYMAKGKVAENESGQKTLPYFDKSGQKTLPYFDKSGQKTLPLLVNGI